MRDEGFFICPDNVKTPVEAFVLWCEDAYKKRKRGD